MLFFTQKKNDVYFHELFAQFSFNRTMFSHHFPVGFSCLRLLLKDKESNLLRAQSEIRESENGFVSNSQINVVSKIVLPKKSLLIKQLCSISNHKKTLFSNLLQLKVKRFQLT